jgi:LCP family protein required for cell wall assembly
MTKMPILTLKECVNEEFLSRADKRRQQNRTTLIKRGVSVVAALGLLAGGGIFAFNNLTSQLKTEDTSQYLKASDRPEKVYATPVDSLSGPLNILLIGSDTREDDPASDIYGMRADTTILAHISGDRKHVDMVSIPRDSLLEIPSCTLPDGAETEAAFAKFNSAFALGAQNNNVGSAAACAIKAVEHNTNVYIDGFAVIDFKGFENVVDTIGGVEFDVKEEIDDPSFDNLVIKAGKQKFNGKTALQYARVRKGTNMDGSDIGRIARQQELMAVIAEKVKSKVSDLPTMYSLVGSFAKMTTTSKELGNVSNTAGLAWALKDVKKENINFMTVPIVDAGDGSNVLWADEAETVWENIRLDKPVAEEETVDSTDETVADMDQTTGGQLAN